MKGGAMADTQDIDEKIRLETLRCAIEHARDAIKACILINGGGAGALLAFMGHLATAGNYRLIRGLLASLALLGGGLMTGIFAHVTAYASYWNLSGNPKEPKWRCYRAVTLGLTLTSLLLFALGGICAYRAFFETAKQFQDRLELKEDLKKEKVLR